MKARLLLSAALLTFFLVGCGNGGSAPKESESVANSMQGLKAGPHEGHDGAPKAQKGTP